MAEPLTHPQPLTIQKRFQCYTQTVLLPFVSMSLNLLVV